MFSRLRLLHRVRCFSTASQEWSGKTSYFRELKPCASNNSPLSPISFLERAAVVYREQTSIVYGPVRFTWPETLERCRRLASALSSLHVKTGDVDDVPLQGKQYANLEHRRCPNPVDDSHTGYNSGNSPKRLDILFQDDSHRGRGISSVHTGSKCPN